MRCLILLVAVIPLQFFALAESQERVAEIRVFVPDMATLQKIYGAGIDAEGSRGRIGGWMSFVAAPSGRGHLTALGIAYTVVAEDSVRPAPAAGYTPGPVSTHGFGYGSWSGFYTYDEVKKQLDSMQILYPSLITARESIGYTWEGRVLWMVKISDNPGIYEESEPEVLYTALHHAREPEGMESLLYYMWWLLQNYGTDSTATYLVNSRQMYFIPVVNPDGYYYNQTTSYPGTPVYGWRKNRRNNGGGVYGVDLNRNYGPDYMWNGPSGGSSPVPSDDTYRGPSPWSEPEIYAIDQFMRSHTIITALNYHTFGNYMIYPFGYDEQETPDTVIYREMAFYATSGNRYIYGTDMETVAYGTRGGSDDYMYGDDTKPKTFAMTPEVGTTGFWPSIGEILPLAMENLSSNIYCSYMAGQYSKVDRFQILDTDGDGYLTAGESFTLALHIANSGLGDAAHVRISQSASSPDLQLDSLSLGISSLPARTDSVVLFHGSVAPDAARNSRITLTFRITDPLGYLRIDSIHLTIGTPVILLADSASGGTTNWTTGEGWGTTTDAHSPPLAFTDSPYGDYEPNADNYLTLKSSLNLVGIEYCTLRYWAKWAIEPTMDFLLVEVSTNGGITWSAQHASLMRKGSGNGVQDPSLWGYDGHTPGLTWREQEVDLSAYSNQQVSLRFRLISDSYGQRDGFLLDDIRVVGYGASYQRSYLDVQDNGSGFTRLNFGENGQASGGLDPLFGETELPQKPARGTFDARWAIPATRGSLTDFLDTLSGANPENLFTAEFQPGAGGYPVSLRWDPRTFNPGGWRLRDAATHGSVFNKIMWPETLVVVTDTSIHSVEILHVPTDTLTVATHTGWNIVSVPGKLADLRKSVLFPHAISQAFAYQGIYTAAETLAYGTGYWIKYASADTMRYLGIPNVLDTLQLGVGWWLIGGIGYALPTTRMACSPPPCTPYIYRSIYVPPPFTVLPGEGFWMKGPKSVIISAMKLQGMPPEKLQAPDALPACNTLTFTEPGGSSSTLYFGTSSAGGSSGGEHSAYELPPLPPEGAFDVRFSSQRYVEEFHGGQPERSAIRIQSPAYPVTLSWTVAQGDQSTYEISDPEGKVPPRALGARGSLTIPAPGTPSLVLSATACATPVPPKEFSLGQNYPNPFNPVSTVAFGLPVASRVTLRVFTALGQEVFTLADDLVYPSGIHQLTIDGRKLASGLYLYRLTALPTDGTPAVQLTKKMLLLR